MADSMSFPDTFDEFAEQYKIIDKEEFYTNGAELIPIFRVKQWLEHKADVVEVVRCKDCKFAYKNRFLGEYHCEKTNCKIKAHHFCGQGIRK